MALSSHPGARLSGSESWFCHNEPGGAGKPLHLCACLPEMECGCQFDLRWGCGEDKHADVGDVMQAVPKVIFHRPPRTSLCVCNETQKELILAG